MSTLDFIALLGIGIMIEAVAIFLLVYGIYSAITDKTVIFCIGMVFFFLFLSSLSVLVCNGVYKEYNDAKLQNHVEILRQKISDAEKEYQKYLIDHPELKGE